MSETKQILRYQQRCFAEYSDDIGLPENYSYIDGNRIRPIVPVATAQGALMIVGAYPSARFESRREQTERGRLRLVPIADNLQPFGVEEYFDGTRVRRLTSGDEIRGHVLDPLDIDANGCWITDLVKVFLYKSAHLDSCGSVNPKL